MEQKRPRIAIAGASSYIGMAVCNALVDLFDVVVLTRSMSSCWTTEAGNRICWQSCDLFSRREVEAALEGVDYAIYLVHNRDPSARLDQARTRDMDVLVADNFARAAALAGVKQIVYRAALVPDAKRMPVTAKAAGEVLQVLSSYGVPVTTIRSNLVVGSGGDIVQLLVKAMTVLPWIPIPRWALTERRPISLDDLITAYRHCVGNPDTFGQSYDIFGPEPLSFQRMLEETASVLGLKRRFIPVSFLPEWFYVAMLRLLHPSLHPDRLTYIIEALHNDMAGRDNPVQQIVASRAIPFRRALEDFVRTERTEEVRHQQHAQRERDDEIIRRMRSVRSIQRLRLPAGRNAAWVADRYFLWLGRVLRPFLSTEADADGSWSILAHPGRIHLLTLTFKPGHSSPDRYLYFITGGKLLRMHEGRPPRLEFRSVLGDRFAVVALHDFNPSLPWVFYRFTQAMVHGLVMKAFQRHMARKAETS